MRGLGAFMVGWDRVDRSVIDGGGAGGSPGPIDRRQALHRSFGMGLGVAAAFVLLRPGSALAAAEKQGLAARLVKLTPMTLPGRTAMGVVRIESELVVRETKTLVADVAEVVALRPRIIGRITQTLAQERPITRGSSAQQVQDLKHRMTDIANEAIGRPLVEDVLIGSLIVS
ncbi:MAG: hypothetical protein RLY86_903 [Pseudomonadota bacterium]